MTERVWRPGRPVDLRATLGALVRGPYDPVQGFDGNVFWTAARTPQGPGTLALDGTPDAITARAWGSGADWLLDRVPALLGAGDDWSGLDLSRDPGLRAVAHRYRGLRLCRTERVMDALVPAILEQRVTHAEARRAWVGLVRRYGEPAPGPRAGLFVPPAPEALLAVPTWTWHRLGVDLARSRAVRAVATVATRLRECVSLPGDAARARLRAVPGVGEWTAAETTVRALGDPDALSVGDFHLAHLVVHYFTGRARGTDEEMAALLAPWAGQRARIVSLIAHSGVRPPRFGPRFAANDIRAV
ncbi:MAG: DNA-3-methyladenine glycosylase 2 family protein [Jatrophihabitans sp.]|nr:MAG: DNA-3-methyladenine glycosylase 2 family protein [Jatrophihabitans sp.]